MNKTDEYRESTSFARGFFVALAAAAAFWAIVAFAVIVAVTS